MAPKKKRTKNPSDNPRSHPPDSRQLRRQTVKQVTKIRKMDTEAKISIWFSVFIGNLDMNRVEFDHARFDARVSEDVFAYAYRAKGNQDAMSLASAPQTPTQSAASKARPHNSNRRPASDLSLEQLKVFSAMVKLAHALNDKILACSKKKACSICYTTPATSLVHKPLCSTRNGYLELVDFDRLQKLMQTIASHTNHLTSDAAKDWAIGSFLSDRPYLCSLAVPICSTGSGCHSMAARNIQVYIDRILKEPRRPVAALATPKRAIDDVTAQPQTPTRSRTGKETVVDDQFQKLSIQPQEGKFHKIGVTFFVGRPFLRIVEPIERGQISVLAFSSEWPEQVLPNARKNEADLAVDYCRITGYHEQHILAAADWRCISCVEVVPAQTLVHRPIAFNRMNPNTRPSNPMRQLIMRFFQFIQPTRYKFLDTQSIFGDTNEAHIYDFVAPICTPGGICEEVARTASREFVKLLMRPEPELTYAFPGLDPDYDLVDLQYHHQGQTLGIAMTAEAGVGVPGTPPEVANSWWNVRNAKTLVEKIGPGGLLSELGDRGEDPNDCVLHLTKLRRWFELCVDEELAKREALREIGYKRADEASVSSMDDDLVEEMDADQRAWAFERSVDVETSLLCRCGRQSEAGRVDSPGSTERWEKYAVQSAI